MRTVGYALPVALHEYMHAGGAAAGRGNSASGEPLEVLSSRAPVDYIAPSFLR